MSAYADAVECLVHDGAHLLIAGTGAHAHSAAVAAVGGRCSRAVGDADAEAVDAGEVVPVVVYSGVDGVIKAVVGGLIAAVVVPMSYGSFWYSHDLDDITVAHCIVLRDGVGTHIIYGGGFEVAQPVDFTGLVDVFGCAVIRHLGVGLFAPAEAFFHDVAAADGAASEGPCGTAHEALVGGDFWCRACTIGHAEGKSRFGQCCYGSFCQGVGSVCAVVGRLGLLHGILEHRSLFVCATAEVGQQAFGLCDGCVQAGEHVLRSLGCLVSSLERAGSLAQVLKG